MDGLPGRWWGVENVWYSSIVDIPVMRLTNARYYFLAPRSHPNRCVGWGVGFLRQEVGKFPITGTVPCLSFPTVFMRKRSE